MARRNIFLLIAGFLVLGLIAGYFVANSLIRQKVDAALRELPASMTVRYSSLDANILTGSLEMRGVEARYMPSPGKAHRLTIDRLAIHGISFVQWVTAHRLRVRTVRADGLSVDLDEELLEKDSAMLKEFQPPQVDALISEVDIDTLKVEGMRRGRQRFVVHGKLRIDSVTSGGLGAIRFVATDATYLIPGMEETARFYHLEMDSRQNLLRLDSLTIRPDRDKEEIGRAKGHQVDVVRAEANGIAVTGLDVMGLMRHRLHADEISLHGSRIFVFRDRRLPVLSGEKPLPVESLEDLPLDLRVKRVRLGPTRFEYEEFPKVGDKPGMLVIERFHALLEPLIDKPVAGDPAFITLTTEGSLMGSGSVTATTRMPLRKGGYYEVEGAFHDLDVTRLNNPAENLGQLHLESGMLNQLDFQFEMSDERSQGKIVGEYHDLVVDKLKEKNGQLKTDKLKSFALKKLIIPRNKDKSLAISKRTGKVDYRRDKERYFSYYLLHSLLVGVKSSFSLGFLLPG